MKARLKSANYRTVWEWWQVSTCIFHFLDAWIQFVFRFGTTVRIYELVYLFHCKLSCFRVWVICFDSRICYGACNVPEFLTSSSELNLSYLFNSTVDGVMVLFLLLNMDWSSPKTQKRRRKGCQWDYYTVGRTTMICWYKNGYITCPDSSIRYHK